MAATRVVQVLQTLLRDGPVDVGDLSAALERHGVRNTSLADIWMVCREHGLAELDDDRWVPRGWSVGSSTSESGPSDPSQAPDGEQKLARPTSESSLSADLTPLARLEITHLRQGANVRPLPDLPRPTVPAAWSTFVDNAVGALQDELTEVSKRRTQTDVALRDGRQVGVTETRVLMRFEADSDAIGRDGMMATLLVDRAPYNVEIVSTFGSMVTLSVPRDAPAVSEATLRCDLSWLLGAQAERLRGLRQGGPGFDPAAALGIVQPVEAPPPFLDAEAAAGTRLNQRQRLAVARGKQPGVTWLWGPPGTGKTSTLSILIRDLFRSGKRILLAAPTNVAVDIALLGALQEMGVFAEGAVVRVGQPARIELVRRSTGSVLVDEVAANRGEAVAARRVEIGEQMRAIRAQLTPTRRRARSDQGQLDLETELAQLSEFAGALDVLMAEIRRQACVDARLVAATAHQVTLATLRDQSFDVVVIDEASMLPAALAALVAGVGCGQTVVAGDFRQLPPVVVAGSDRARAWLGRSAFEASGVARRVLSQDPPHTLVALNEQYRMPERLSEAVSDGFYPENRLITSRRSRGRQDGMLTDAHGPVLCLDTSWMRPRAARRNGGTSRYNLLHVLAIGMLVDQSAISGTHPALITPFAPQARLLESLLGEDGQRGDASTVHRYQGSETDVVIFDAVDTAGGGMKMHPWYEDGSAGGDGARLMNVAASRAKQRLILVADLDRIHRSRKPNDAVGTFIRSLLSDAQFLRPADLAPGLPLPSDLDVAALAADVEQAEHRIEIWSLQVADATMAVLQAPLLRAAKRGCAVSIWFEPQPRGALPSAFEGLRRHEILLRPCRPVRESSAVIDHIVWASSGAVLGAQPGRTLRRADSDLARAVTRVTRRRGWPGVPGTGDAAGACHRCGALIVRVEGRSSVRASCLVCDIQIGKRG